MQVYDIEVLDIIIGDNEISYFLKDYQKHIVKQNLEMNKLQKDLDNTKKEEEISRQILSEKQKTDDVRVIINKNKIETANSIELLKVNAEKERQLVLDEISKMILEMSKLKDDHKLEVEEESSKIRTQEYEKQMSAIQPKLIEAMITLGGVKTTEILAKNLKEQGNDWTNMFKKGGLEGLLDTVKGTPLYDNIVAVLNPKKAE